MAFEVYAAVGRGRGGRAVRVDVGPIRCRALAGRVAALVRRFLRLPDVRFESAPEWAFAVRRALGARGKGARVRVRRAG